MLLDNVPQELGVSVLLLAVLPLAAGRGCSEHPSPFSGSRLGHLQKEGSKGKVLASEGSRGAQVLGKAGGKLENCHGNYATRRGFIASSRPTAWAWGPLCSCSSCRYRERYPGVFTRCFQIHGGKVLHKRLE